VVSIPWASWDIYHAGVGDDPRAVSRVAGWDAVRRDPSPRRRASQCGNGVAANRVKASRQLSAISIGPLSYPFFAES
jgi:hypothetical protein